jgi:hypothetical protein
VSRAATIDEAGCGRPATTPQPTIGPVAPAAYGGRVFVKVCGVMTPADAATAAAAAAVSVAAAGLAVVPDHLMTVGVFRDHAPTR